MADAKQLLMAKMRKQRQRSKQGITDERKQKIEQHKVEREQNKQTAQATEAAKPVKPEQRDITLSPSAASLLKRKIEQAKPDKDGTVGTSDLLDKVTPVTDGLPMDLGALAQTDKGTVEVAVTVHTDGQPLGKNEITYDMFNEKQKLAVDYAKEGKSFCLIGGAGTGKTTTQRGAVSELVASGLIKRLDTGTDRVLRVDAPAIAVLSFTNKAVSNIKAALPDEYKPHCSTMHKILEYKPEEYEEELVDEYGSETGEVATRRRFVPTYGTTEAGDGDGLELPHLDVVIIEEAGSVPTELFNILLRALPHHEDTVFIFLGDLNQLPPVFGDAILGYKLLDLPIVELTEVYRQAQLSPITNLAVTIQKGRGISDAALADMARDAGEHGILEVIPFKPAANKLTRDEDERYKMAYNFGKHLYELTINGEFDPATDAVLIPFNKQFGTIELNKWVGQALRDMKDLVTYHVRAGREEYFLCEGDKVMYDKQECIITSIEPNEKYLGEPTIVASTDLDRWGRNRGHDVLKKEFKSFDEMAAALDHVVVGDVDEKVNQASHIVTMMSLENEGLELVANTSAQLNGMLPLNVLTVHKSQGSEWRKVILVLHTSHATMWSRELIYTAVTRARHHLKIYYSGEQRGKINGSAFQRGVIKSEFKGVTLEDKLQYFRNKRKAEQLNAEAQLHKAQRSIEMADMVRRQYA